MAIAGTLSVNIIAVTQKFSQGIKKATAKLSTFRLAAAKTAMGMSALSKATLGFGGAIGGVALAAGFVSLIKNTTNSVDRINKLSTQLGVSTEQLSIWVNQADLAGVSQESLASSIKRMQRSLGDASRGLATALVPYERLGLVAAELVNMDPAKAFGKIIEKMAEMENPTLLAATSMEVFGRGGTEMIPLFTQNLEKLKRRFIEVGGVLRKDMADRFSALKDETSDVGLSFQVLGRDMVDAFGPTLLNAMKTIRDKMAEIRKGVDTGRRKREAAPELERVLTKGKSGRRFSKFPGAETVTRKVAQELGGVNRSFEDTERLENKRSAFMQANPRLEQFSQPRTDNSAEQLATLQEIKTQVSNQAAIAASMQKKETTGFL